MSTDLMQRFVEMNKGWKLGDPIGYIRQDIPKIELPLYRGQRYEAMVPDTLDLAERAKLAVNGLTESADPQADYEPYPIVLFMSKPPQMIHNFWHTPLLGKFVMGLNLVRLMSGSEQNLHVEQAWLEMALKKQGEDGLIYTPLKGRPWAYEWYTPHALEDSLARALAQGGQQLSPYGTATLIGGLSVVARRSGDPFWKEVVRRLVDGLIILTAEAGDMAYVSPSILNADKNPPPNAKMPTSSYEIESSILPHALVHAYRMTGCEAGMRLVPKYFHYLRCHFFGPDGTFYSSPGCPDMAHFHAHARTLLAMTEYAEITGDREVIDFVIASYEWAKGLLANHEGDASIQVRRVPGADLIGFFPEWANASHRTHGETCQVTDMITTALRLSEAGVADYWDDADRWIRNHFAECQFIHTDWINRIVRGVGSQIKPYGTTERVAERIVGAFAGTPDPSDLYSGGHDHGIGHCCTANGSKALYWIWERILRCHDGKLRVNLLLNRASAWADVDSYIPYQGRVDVRVKQNADLSIRIPEWVSLEKVHCQVNGQERALQWEGRYAQVGLVQPGDVATLTFPISERTNRISIEKHDFTIVRKGNDVVSMHPPGQFCPLYQRQHYRDNEPRWRRVIRFVSDEGIEG